MKVDSREEVKSIKSITITREDVCNWIAKQTQIDATEGTIVLIEQDGHPTPFEEGDFLYVQVVKEK